MSKLAIKAENISKQYRLGEVGTGTLSHDLNRFWHKVRGKEDPYLQIGQANDRSQKTDSNYVWSLKDINFEIEQGDAVGIIGRNGAGKSTLLKLLSKVTKPTTGRFHVNGRIASLLEVGTGFNPEMTGRENIYMNGAILGMRRHEITRKFDEIVAFSGVEAYIDTPVKRYSSGMYVRLAFAVAAHLESEILIVDEVLAVGDAEFQKKCLGKMGDVSKGEGRTVLFVSHNMASIEALCKNAILLSSGSLLNHSDTKSIIKQYFELNYTIKSALNFKKHNGLGRLIWIETYTINEKNEVSNFINLGQKMYIFSKFVVNENIKNTNLSIAIAIYNSSNVLIVDLWNLSVNYSFHKILQKDEIYSVSVEIPNINLAPDLYNYNILIQNNFITEDFIENAGSFEILGGTYLNFENSKFGGSIVLMPQKWEIQINL
jgi:lipopolysaccharide transport system ATP-binding protein